jgi:hypothetical protein
MHYLDQSSRYSFQDVSFICQRLDNRGTVIAVDPVLADRYPTESDADLYRRVKLESAYVKMYGKELAPSRSPWTWLLNGPAPAATVIVDGDAFVVDFPVDSRDVEGRRSGMLCFGHLPRDRSVGLSRARDRLAYVMDSIDGLDFRRFPFVWERLSFSLDRLSRERSGQACRPKFRPLPYVPPSGSNSPQEEPVGAMSRGNVSELVDDPDSTCSRGEFVTVDRATPPEASPTDGLDAVIARAASPESAALAATQSGTELHNAHRGDDSAPSGTGGSTEAPGDRGCLVPPPAPPLPPRGNTNPDVAI